jgi:predicted transcriptional regulator
MDGAERRFAAGAVELEADTLAAIDRGAEETDQGWTVSLDDARKLIAKWVSDWSG